ncbi:conserved Plasmodium protein, unknown function [Plasmodium gaboni]|uniref:C2H2-type domain-containing protein n=1 Tax=Plasmodium gaboni TaxID=647221 RepID=A0ABY1UR20_9APIC|nr:conserved Plasmodium protein, unknown function [Plasmodium gaboni]
MSYLISDDKNVECLNLNDIRLKAEKYNWLEKSEKKNSYIFCKDNVKINIIDLKGLVTIEVQLLNGISYKMCRSNIRIDEISRLFGPSNNYYAYNDIINKTILCNYNLSVKEKIDLFNKKDKTFLKQNDVKNILKCETNKVISYNINNKIIKGKDINCNNRTNENFHLIKKEPLREVEKIYTKRKEKNIFIKHDKQDEILLFDQNKLFVNIENDNINNKIYIEENVEGMICKSKTILMLKENNNILREPYYTTDNKYGCDKFIYDGMNVHNVQRKEKKKKKNNKKLKSESYKLLYFYNKTNKIYNHITLNVLSNKISYFCFFNNFFYYKTIYEYKYIHINNNKKKDELDKRRITTKLFNNPFESVVENMSEDNTNYKPTRSKKNMHNVICPYNNIFNCINNIEENNNYGDNIYTYNFTTRNTNKICQIKKDKYVNHNLFIKKKKKNHKNSNNNNNNNMNKNISSTFNFNKYNTNKYIKKHRKNNYNIYNELDKKYSIYHKNYKCNRNNFIYKDLKIYKEKYPQNCFNNNINICNYFKRYEMNNAEKSYNHLDIQTFNNIKREEHNIYEPMYEIRHNAYNKYHNNKCNNINNYIHKNFYEYNSYDLYNNMFNISTIIHNNYGNDNNYEMYYSNNSYDKRESRVSSYMQRGHNNKSYMNKRANILNKKYNNLLFSNEEMFNKSLNKKEKINRIMYMDKNMNKLYDNRGINNNFNYLYKYEELERFNHICPSSYKKKNQLQKVKNEIYKKLSYLKYFQHDNNRNIPRYNFFIKHLLYDYCKKKLHIWLKVMLVKQKCGYCNEQFENIDILENHLKYVKTHKVFYCCQKPFPSLKYLYMHLKRKNHYGYIYYY